MREIGGKMADLESPNIHYLRCFMAFLTVFQLYPGAQCTYPCFPGVLATSTLLLLNILPKPMAAFSHNHCRNNRQRWRGMNPVVMTIANPRKE